MLNKNYIEKLYKEFLGGLSHHANWEEFRMIERGEYEKFMAIQKKRAQIRMIGIAALSLIIFFLMLNNLTYLEQFSSAMEVIQLLLITISCLGSIGFFVMGLRNYFCLTFVLKLLKLEMGAEDQYEESISHSLGEVPNQGI